MTIFRLQRAFSSKGKENYEKAKKDLEKLDYEELDKKVGNTLNMQSDMEQEQHWI